MSLPLEHLDKTIGSSIWIITKDELEYSGTLVGFDGLGNVVLENVTQFDQQGQTHRQNLLLQGKFICMMIPGPRPNK